MQADTANMDQTSSYNELEQDDFGRLCLATGQSLRTEENCRLFLQAVLALPGVAGASAWLTQFPAGATPPVPVVTLVHAMGECEDGAMRAMAALLAADDGFAEGCRLLPPDKTDFPHGGAAFRLERAGLLLISFIEPVAASLFCGQRFAEATGQFAVSFRHCLAYGEMERRVEKLAGREQQLLRIAATSQKALESIPDSLVWLDREGTVRNFRRSEEMALPLPKEIVIGSRVGELVPPEIAKQILDGITRTLATGQMQTLEYRYAPAGRVVVREARMVASGPEEVLAFIRDITDRKIMEEKLAYLGMHDAATGLYNRAYFEQEMRRLDDGRYAPVSLVMCDVDGLKLVNDTLGHDLGDALLLAASDIIKKCFRKGDVVARIGGDEFAILLASTPEAMVRDKCSKIHSAVELYNKNNPQFPLSISVGFATSDGLSVHELFKEADNQMYREKLHHGQNARDTIVRGLTKALEARDFILEGHAERLQQFSARLAASYGLLQRGLADIKLLAQFHDIGKVGIPDRILFKPSRLDAQEFAEMQRHAEIGYRIAQSIPELTPIADLILKHHEWWNGSGYPIGLKAEEIPRECRIFAIIDAYDAMTSGRPYRPAIGHQEAVKELQSLAGIQFDPRIVRLFLYLLGNGMQLTPPGGKTGGRA